MLENNYFTLIILTFISIIFLVLFIGTITILIKIYFIYQRRGLHPNHEAKTNSDYSRSIHQRKEGIQGQQNTKTVHPINHPLSKVSIQQGEIEPISGIILVNPTPKAATPSQTSIPRIEVSKTSQGTNRVINNGGQQINTGSNQEMNCKKIINVRLEEFI
ncbi:unnamed protein product [Meloidogyne enterolobii]|uniref:Uncharacterized protein n=1 Tax=Meloidogyne enterolobii TaxID=390850 RepID=A0ACB0ZJ32_MELEN